MLLIFDPPQCCSTGICGSDVDPVLVQFAADLKWLAEQGISVERFNLSQQPEAFVQDSQVRDAIGSAGMDALPLLMLDGRKVSQGTYPTRDELARWTGLALNESEFVSLDVISSEGSCCSSTDETCC